MTLEWLLQEDVPKPPPEEQYMLAQMQEVRRQLQASQQREAQKKVSQPCHLTHPWFGNTDCMLHLACFNCH